MKNEYNMKLSRFFVITLLILTIIAMINPLNISAFGESGKLFPGQVVSGKYGKYSASYTTVSNISKTTGTAYTHGCITVYISSLAGGEIKKSTCYSNPQKTIYVSKNGRAKHRYFGGLGQ